MNSEEQPKNDANQNSGNPYNSYNNFNYGGNLVVPYSIPVLVLGILSIVFCWCYGILSVIMGIVALVLAAAGEKEYRLNPASYSISSYKNLRAGKACAIIGLCLAGIAIVMVVIYIIIFGSLALSMLNFGLVN